MNIERCHMNLSSGHNNGGGGGGGAFLCALDLYIGPGSRESVYCSLCIQSLRTLIIVHSAQ